MSTTTLQKVLRRLKSAENYVHWRVGGNSHESVYFYTLHKCASSLFGGYVLQNIKGLRHVNYASRLYGGKHVKEVNFEKTGHMYGPIRISANQTSPVYTRLVEPATQTEFIRDKTAIFLVRDPRDILVSAYFSFGFNHGYSPVEEIRERQMRSRKEIQEMTIDEYVLSAVDTVRDNFKTVDELHRACDRSVVLRYEQMVTDFDAFIKEFTKYMDIKPSVVRQMFERTRPKVKEDTTSHRRSGKPGGFKGKLQDQTIDELNSLLESTLNQFQYEV